MTDLVTVTGYVATPPRHIVTSAGLPITTFRIVSNQRRFDRQQQKWVEAGANWYTIASFRKLAVNVEKSIEKGQNVVVTGRVRIRDWESGERTGTTVEIEADAIGHDLSWGTATFVRTPTADRPAELRAVEPGEGGGEPAPEPDAAEAETWAPAAALPF